MANPIVEGVTDHELQSGNDFTAEAPHETIPMTVDDTIANDSDRTAAPMAETINTSSVVPIIDTGVRSRPIGDTTEPMDAAQPHLEGVDNHGPVALVDVVALPAELRDTEGQGYSIALTTDIEVDLGLGIFVGGLSRDGFDKILAFPTCIEE